MIPPSSSLPSRRRRSMVRQVRAVVSNVPKPQPISQLQQSAALLRSNVSLRTFMLLQLIGPSLSPSLYTSPSNFLRLPRVNNFRTAPVSDYTEPQDPRSAYSKANYTLPLSLKRSESMMSVMSSSPGAMSLRPSIFSPTTRIASGPHRTAHLGSARPFWLDSTRRVA